MTGRERILNTLEFKGTDRIPMDVWVLPAARMEHGERLAALPLCKKPVYNRANLCYPKIAVPGMDRAAKGTNDGGTTV